MLIARARHLRAQHPDWRILVLCYNRVLAGFLRTALDGERVEVSTFHAWCTQQLTGAGVDVPEPPGRGPQWDDFWVVDRLRTQEEARRLLYIAMTRARDELCISSARPSRVMDELARAVTSAAA